MFYPVKHGDFLEDDGNSVLNIHATLFDSVQCHRALSGITNSDTSRKELIKAFCLLTDEGSFSIWRLRQLFESLIFGDKTSLLQHPPPRERQIQERAKRLVLGFYEDLCRLFGPEPAFTDFLRLLECCMSESKGYKTLEEEVRLCDPEQLHLNQMEYLIRAAETTDRQAGSMFFTAAGRLGIGPRSVQRDDVVVIARGCRVPLVLRQCAPYYRLVGPVYVSGIMQGEVVRHHERKGPLSFEPVQLV